MSQLKNPLEVYKILPKSNCGECSVPTCMAFAAAVLMGNNKLADCPHIPSSISESFAKKIATHKSIAKNREEVVKKLKSKVSAMSLISFGSAAIAVQTLLKKYRLPNLKVLVDIK